MDLFDMNDTGLAIDDEVEVVSGEFEGKSGVIEGRRFRMVLVRLADRLDEIAQGDLRLKVKAMLRHALTQESGS